MSRDIRHGACKSICTWLDRSNVECKDDKRPKGYERCFTPIFGPDEVHPTRTGHAIVKDLIVEALASVGRDVVCGGQDVMRHVLPQSGGWIVGRKERLEALGNFIMVHDTMILGTHQHHDRLTPETHSKGFSFYSDTKPNPKEGWIATNPQGGETITFLIDLPRNNCYVVYLAILRSYQGMGQFIVTVKDKESGTETVKEADGLWDAHISVWSDIQLTDDKNTEACRGSCEVTVLTKPEVKGRKGNKVKIYTLSVRKCEGKTQ